MSKNFDELVAVMARLRAPGGCPWDREQTYASLSQYLIEECYETFDAIQEADQTGDTKNLREELGDGFEGIEIDSGPGNPNKIPRTAHSVVTKDLIDVDGHPTQAALQRLLGFFAEQLRP